MIERRTGTGGGAREGMALAAMLALLLSGLGCGEPPSGGTPDGGSATDGGDAGPEPDGGAADGGPDGGADGGTPDGSSDGGRVSDGLHPVLTGFRVEAGAPDRLVFDSSEAITATETTGFVISNRQASGLTIQPGQTTGHYFTVTEPFTFWDNNTLRYEGGGDLMDLEGLALHPFTLRFVRNELPEPPAPVDRFVTVSGGGARDGSSEADAWTLAEAGASAAPGETVWVKAGDYGDQPLAIPRSGRAGSPIKFIGYTDTPGDAPRLPRDQDTVFDPTLLPHIHSGAGTGAGIELAGEHHLILKNLQVTGYDHSLLANGNVSEVLLENLYVRGGRYGINLFAYATTNTRVLDSYVSDTSGAGIRVAGDHNLIDGMVATSRGAPSMDYYISLYGGTIGLGNIVRRSSVIRDPADSHTGHGISVKASGRPLEHTLIEDCTLHQVGQAIELRHHQVRHTVARGITATGTRTGASNLVTFRDDTSYNIVENSRAHRVYEGIRFVMNAGEDQGIQPGGHHNRVINTVFDDCRYGITIGGFGGPPLESTNNSFEHCTFRQLSFLFALPIDFGDTNTFTHCNLDGVAEETFNSGTATTSFTHSNFWDSWGVPAGEGNLSVDPGFVDAGGGDLRPTNAALRSGPLLSAVPYDLAGVERPAPSTLGALEP